MISPIETGLRVVAALYLIGCGAYAAYGLGGLLVGPARLPLRWTATAVVGMWLATAGFALLLPLGAFTLAGGLTTATLAAVTVRVVFVRARGEAPGALGRRDGRALRRLARAWRASPGHPVTFFFGILGILLVARTLVVPPLGWDTITYHGARAALWVQTGQMTLPRAPGTWDLYRHYFAGSEVFAAWAMLPLHSDLLAGAVDGVQWLALAVALWTLGRELELREPYAASAALAGAFVPTVQSLVGSGFSDLTLYAALFAGLAATVHLIRRPAAGVALVAAVAFGVAAGIKPQGAPPAAVGLAVVAWRMLRASNLPLSKRLGLCTVGLVVAAVPAAPWLLLAYRDTGFPLSPFPVHLGPLTLGVPNDELRWYMNRPGLAPYRWDTEISALGAVFALPGVRPIAIGGPYLLPLVFAPVGLFRLLRARPWTGALALAMLATILAIHFSPSMSVVRLLWAPSASRMVVPAVLLALPVSMVGCAGHPRLGRLYRGAILTIAGFYGLFMVRRGWAPHEYLDVFVLVAAGALFIVGWLRFAPRSRGIALGLVGVALAAGLLALDARRDTTRPESLQSSSQMAWTPRYWADATERVDDPPHVHRIAMTSGPYQNSDNWFSYFFLGRHLQNRMLYVSPLDEGHAPPRLLAPSTPAAARNTNEKAWIARLERAGVTEVMSFKPLSLEKIWMDRTPSRFERLAWGPDWGFYRFVPRSR